LINGSKYIYIYMCLVCNIVLFVYFLICFSF